MIIGSKADVLSHTSFVHYMWLIALIVTCFILFTGISVSPYADDLMVIHLDTSSTGVKGDMILQFPNIYEVCTKLAIQTGNEALIETINEKT